MNEIKVNIDNLTAEQKEQLLALIEKGSKKPFEAWKPTINDNGFCVFGNGTYSNGQIDYNGFYKQGRVFPTKEQAELFSRQERILTQYRRLAEESWAGEMIVWDCISQKYCLGIISSGLSITSCASLCLQGTVYFKTRESLEKAIETIGEKNIIHYLI